MQNAPREHSAILSTFINTINFVFETFVLSIFEWKLKTGFTVSPLRLISFHNCVRNEVGWQRCLKPDTIYFADACTCWCNNKVFVWFCVCTSDNPQVTVMDYLHTHTLIHTAYLLRRSYTTLDMETKFSVSLNFSIPSTRPDFPIHAVTK